MIKNKALDGIKIKSCGCPHTDVCRICSEGKFTRQKFSKKRSNKSYAFLDLVHSDLCGPFDVATPGGHRYFLTMIEDQSRYCHGYFLKRKSDAYEKFKEYIAFVKNQFGKCFKTLRSDRGGFHQKSNPHTPQQNGCAERRNRCLVEMCRCLLFQANLDIKY